MYKTHSRKEFLEPIDTRYASDYLLLKRMLEVQSTLKAMVVTLNWYRRIDERGSRLGFRYWIMING